MQEKNWYHTLPLALLTLAALVTGVLCVWLGASLSKPYYLLDDLFLRLLGLGMLAGFVLLLRASHLGFSLVGAGFALGALEFTISSVLADQPHSFREIFLICGGQLALAVLAFWLDYTFYHVAHIPQPEPVIKRSEDSKLDTHWLNVTMQYLLVIFSVAAVSLLVAAPILTLAGWISYAALGLLALLFFIAHGRPVAGQRTFAPLLGFAAAALLLLPIAGISERMEHGYVDGPYFGTPHSTELRKMHPRYRLKYRDGLLAVYNRSRSKAPLLVYYNEDDEPEWATEMFIPQKAGSKRALLLRISSPEIETGLLRDKLAFKAHSRHDRGSGEAYIWRFGSLQSFYLSW